MSGRGRTNRGRRRGRARRGRNLQAEIATLKVELRTSNTGAFSKRTACIRTPPWELFAKIYRTVRVQYAGTYSGTLNLFTWGLDVENNTEVLRDIYIDFTIRGWGSPGDSLGKPLPTGPRRYRNPCERLLARDSSKTTSEFLSPPPPPDWDWEKI